MKKYIAYYRVSTKQQGLGLEAQQTIVTTYIQNNGGTLVSEYSEKESGKETTHRLELAKAMQECKKNGYTLIVAKLDRLSRDQADTHTIFKTLKNNIVVCEQDVSDTLLLGIFAALAMKEREMISLRTKQALAELKAKGVRLGNPNLNNGTEEAKANWKAISSKGVEKRTQIANSLPENTRAWAVIKSMTGSLRDKAEALNSNGFTTPKGGKWNAIQVSRLIARFSK